ALQKEVLQIATDEQRRIGQDLHDTTAQELTGLVYLAQSLCSQLQEKSLPESKTAEKITEGLKRAAKQLRTIAKGLIPVEVGSEGLMSGLLELAAATSDMNGIRCRFQCEQPVAVADDRIATQLYRIAQEAVTNAVKHGRPEHVQLTLERSGETITLKISDDGVGIPDQPVGRGMGLQIMTYRAGLIGANLEIGASDKGGTLVTCTLKQN
ncbi:MAG: sensor histidine kinase, partial [Planctomycetes bacterium]|nr:sensor histidine kinase [Planctomycetota bacterium]